MSLLEVSCRNEYPGGFSIDAAFEMNHPVTALFGPSGSGKTSLLWMIAGFIRPQSGRVAIGERTLLDTEADICLPPERRRLGMVFQDHLLFPHMTVEGNLNYGKRHRPPNCRIEFPQVVDVLEIGPLLTRFPRNLSGGERQRVALGRALLSGPELLLMDEPLASLDAALKVRILTYLKRVADQWEIPTLFVSHSPTEVRRIAGWVVVIDSGRIVTEAAPEDALSRPEPLRWTDSAAPMNLLKLDEVRRDGDHVTGLIAGQKLYLPVAAPPPAADAFVQFSPAEVTLGRRDVEGISARNHLRGTVVRMVEVDRAVFVAVDIGQILWAEVTRGAVKELELKPGSDVVCLLKAHVLHLID